MDLINDIMQLLDIGRYRQVLTNAEYRQILSILETAQARLNEQEDK